MLCRASLHETQSSAFSPRVQRHWLGGGTGPCWAKSQVKPRVLCCAECSLEATAELDPVFQGVSWGCCCLLGSPPNTAELHGAVLQRWDDQHFPKEAACSEEKILLLCFKLLGYLASLRGMFLDFSLLLQNLRVAGTCFGMCWALHSVPCRDCSYLDLPHNSYFFFTSWVRCE